MRSGGEVAYVAVGSNLGDREAILAAVIRSIDAEPEIHLLAASPVFETDPFGPGDQDCYLNAAVCVRTWYSPQELLGRLQRIEFALGRDRSPSAQRWGARRVDLDILFFGDRCIESPELVVPHPRAHERAFVMTPMAELAPDFAHPILGSTMLALARDRPDPETVRPWPRPAGWPGG